MTRYIIAQGLRKADRYTRFRYYRLRAQGEPPVYAWFIVRPLSSFYKATQ
jgi:hypothetical protein